MALMPKKAAKTKNSKAVKAVKKPAANKAKAKAPARKPSAAQKPAKKAAKPAPAKKAGKAKTKAKEPVKSVPQQPEKKVFGKPPFPIKGPKTPSVESSDTVIKPGKNRSLNAKFLEQQKHKLTELRDHMLDQMQGVAQTNLRSPGDDSQVSAFGMHQADAGSDAYEKDFALSLLSQEQDALYEINAAIKRIEDGSYGICEMSGQPIPMSRLEAIPFARFTVECQSQIEKERKGKNRWDTSAQFMDNVENFYEEEETEEEDSDKPKLKE
jgi:RNA polymerase-binding transcription factor DksA